MSAQGNFFFCAHVLQLAAVLQDVQCGPPELPRPRRYRDAIRAGRVETVVGGMPNRLILSVAAGHVGARKRPYDGVAAEIGDRDGGTQLFGENLLGGRLLAQHWREAEKKSVAAFINNLDERGWGGRKSPIAGTKNRSGRGGANGS